MTEKNEKKLSFSQIKFFIKTVSPIEIPFFFTFPFGSAKRREFCLTKRGKNNSIVIASSYQVHPLVWEMGKYDGRIMPLF